MVISFLLLAGLQNPGVEQITAAHTVRYWGLLHTHGGEREEREQREQVVSEVRFTRNAYHSASQDRAWLLPGGLLYSARERCETSSLLLGSPAANNLTPFKAALAT